MAKDDDGPRNSARPIFRSRNYGPLSDEACAWEKERLKEVGLENIPWDPGVDCPYCRAGGPDRISAPEQLLTLLMFLRG